MDAKRIGEVTKFCGVSQRGQPRGLRTTAGQAITPCTRDEALAAMEQAQQLSLWQTPPAGQRPLYIGALEDLLRPISREDAIFWVSRLMQHITRPTWGMTPEEVRNRDSVILSDTATDLAGQSHSAVILACDKLRREAELERKDGHAKLPPFPPSGEILKNVTREAAQWAKRLSELTSARPPSLTAPAKQKEEAKLPRALPWAGMDYLQVVDGGMLDAVIAHCRSLPDGGREYCKYLADLCGFAKDFWFKAVARQDAVAEQTGVQA